MKYFILLLVLLLACSDNKPTGIFADDNPQSDDGVTRVFNASGRCWDCTGASAKKYCVEVAGYQELVSFTCATDIDGSVCGRPKNYLNRVTCWKAR